jgi:hypothetical protein
MPAPGTPVSCSTRVAACWNSSMLRGVGSLDDCVRAEHAAATTATERKAAQRTSGTRRTGEVYPFHYVRDRHTIARRVELDTDRTLRVRNKRYYRFNHWPIWIFVFFIAPGPLTFDLFERGFDDRMAIWLGAVLLGTGIAGLAGKLPGCEPAPYIIRFTEDRPNPLYRRICYTTAWGEMVAFALLNIVGLVAAIVTGDWYLKQIYRYAYFPVAGTVWLLGAMGRLPRVKPSTAGEGHERRYFYGTAWAVLAAQPTLWVLWRTLPQGLEFDVIKLLVFVGILASVGLSASLGLLPRTRPIVPGELAVSD